MDKLESWAKDEQSRGPSVEAQREQDIGINIGRIFEQQALQEEVKEAKGDAKDKVDKAIEFGRHKSELAVLNAINKAVTANSNYTTKINSEWQKKTLELQYRLLFASRDILETNKQAYEDTKTLLTAISKNTALPEYVKLRNTERIMEQSRNKFINQSLDSVQGYGKRVAKNVQNQITNSIGTINDMASMAETATGMVKMMEDLEGKKSLGEHAGKAGGGWLAGKMMDFMIGKGGAKLKQDPKRLDKFAKVTNKVGYFLNNKDRLMQDVEDYDEDDPNIIKRLAGKGMRAFSGSKGVDTSMRRVGIDEMGSPGLFTNQVAKSITDIIPGYLSRILKEVTVLRTGDAKTSLTTYDHKTGRFTSEKALTRLHKKQFTKGNKAVEDTIQPILAQIDSVDKLSDDERAKVSRFLMDYSLSGRTFSIKKFSDSKVFEGQLPANLAEKVANSFQSISGRLDPDSAEYSRQDRDLSKSFNGIAGALTTKAKDTQDLVTFGQERIAKKAGMLTTSGNYNLASQKDHLSKRIGAPGSLTHRSQEDIYQSNLNDTRPDDYAAEERQKKVHGRGRTI